MALRVLLADESSTIKKVMQLSLQDFGVEVKAVPVGLDVTSVAKSFRPDIIFADVLLAKRTGYEVCADLKADPLLRAIPVVLMWSGFMEFDEVKAKAGKADQRLEKPFDAETLRNLVKELVPSMKNNAIAGYLEFPQLPEFVEEPDDFQHVSLATVSNPEPDDKKETEPWSAASLDRFKIEIPKDDFSEDINEAASDFTDASIELSSGNGEIRLSDLDEARPQPKTPQQTKTSSMTFGAAPQLPAATASSLIDPVHAEQILREQVRQVLQDIAWKIIPDIAERVVREELQKLLKDFEKLG